MIAMLKNNFFLKAVLLLALLTTFLSCKKDKEIGGLKLNFVHKIDNKEVELDKMIYTNAAGNIYEITEIQYFISEINLTAQDGTIENINLPNQAHYVDIEIPSTLELLCSNNIPAKDYKEISFVFGISKANNKSGIFVNPPERDMFWPERLGGGYHYMKLNCKWLADDSTRRNGNFHLGIGKIDENTFEHYFFKVVLPCNLSIKDNATSTARIKMNVASWFETPHTWDWNVIGGAIMEKPEAMKKGCENGFDVFSIEKIY